MGESLYPCTNCGVNPGFVECPKCGTWLCDSCLSSGDCPNCGIKEERMDRQIIIWCSKCGSQIDERDNVYCEPCIDVKDEELQALEDKIGELENEKERLHEELMEYRT